MGLIRNQVYGSPVPWVRIPPSPPVHKKGDSDFFRKNKVTVPFFSPFFSGEGMGFRALAHPTQSGKWRNINNVYKPAHT